MMLRSLLLLFTLCLFQGTLIGQNADVLHTNLKFKNISLKDGLSQNSVLCILQDDEGFLWFGTRNGLNKYDGNTFTTYQYDAEDSTSLSNSYIKTLFQDDRGNLWIGTRNGLNKYDEKSNNFQRYIHPGTNKGELKDEIWSIIADDEDHLWIGSNFGLGRMSLAHQEFQYYTHQKNDSTSLSHNLIRALEKTTDGKLWIKTVEGVNLYNDGTNTFKHIDHPEDSSKKIGTNPLPTLYEDSQKNLWLGLTNGLAILREDLNRFDFFSLPSSNESAITDDVRSIYEDDFGNLWIGTYEGLYVISPDKKSISHFVHDENDENSLSQNSIYKIYGDSRGDIWIGTYAGGVNYFNRSYGLFKHFPPGTNNTKLSYKVVSSIVEDEDRNLWIGTEGGGINFYHEETGVFTYYTHDKANQNSLSSNNVKAMILDQAGNFWIGTHEEGLNFLNPNKRPFIFEKYRNIPGDSASLSNDRVIALFEDDNNNVWIGTSGGGLNVLDKATREIERVTGSAKEIGEIIYTISGTSEANTILVGGERALAKINTQSKTISPIPFRGAYKDLSGSNPVICTFKGQDNDLWIGTEGAGLYRYDVASKTSKRFGVEDGLPNDVVYGILPDDNNNLWLSTVHGLSRLNLQTLQFKNFYESDGLQSNEFNYGAYLKNDDGELLFGGVNGFNTFDPDKIIENDFVPPVSIISVRLNNEPFVKDVDSYENLTLRHDHNILDFDYVALSYSQPDKNEYAYKLEGFDTDWNYVKDKKSATYTNLDAGDYTFMVKASNNDGLWNEKGKSIAFTVLPAPWRTWWAYTLYVIAFVSALYLIRKNGIQRINSKNKLKQERLEKERIEEVNRMKLELFTNVSHDFRTPLTLIIGPLERMLKAKEGNSFVQKQLVLMHRNASVLMELVNQLLDFRKSEAGKMQLQAAESNIVFFAREVKLAFEELANSRNIDYSLSASSANIQVWFDKDMLRKVLFNLLSNAFKFTPDNGRITIDISEVEKSVKGEAKAQVEISVRDNGSGIPKENIDLIFDRFSQFGDRFGTGIGLPLTKSLVELHQGYIKVKSAEKKGTCFSVLLPLGNAHLQKEQRLPGAEATEEIGLYSFDKSSHFLHKTFVPSIEDRTDTSYDESLPSLLIVEDNTDVRNFIKEIFQNTHNLFEAANGKIGIEIAKASSIDVVISDVMMPIMDGMELCREIKSNIRTSHIPVVLLTARTASEHQKSGYRKGADAYITKPFDPEILELRVKNLLQSRRDLIEKFKKDLILQPKEVTVTSADEEFLLKAIKIVEEHMTDSDFTVQVFIRQMNMSRSALYRKLKSLTDQSLTEFIRVIKLKRAAQLMLKTDMTISEIAFELGFNDKKYFRQSFKEQFHKTPSKYRSETSHDIG